MIVSNLEKVRAEICELEAAHRRSPGSVTLLAVSKKKPLSAIRQALAAGQQSFGENYADEGADKIRELGESPAAWHFIGHIQSNKTRLIASHYNWVQSVDRAKIIERLSLHRPDHLPPLNICLQVNIDSEDTKSGCQPHELHDLATLAASKPNLQLRGLMAIPAPPNSMDAQRAVFSRVRTLFDSLSSDFSGIDTLSMGMTADMGAAIAEGATMVRVGTAIFGQRD
jgi:pyridoxal phosphate enzyme (YggS family)